METPMLHQARELSGNLDSQSKLEQAEFSLRVETSAAGQRSNRLFDQLNRSIYP
jgi:hypothetical protein